jgi:hypothetical protein
VAIETHNVTPDDVLDELPFATGGVTANSDGLSTDEIDGYIRRYAGRVNAVLSGRDELPAPDEIGDELRQVVRGYILAGVKKLCLEKREYPEDRIGRLEDEASDLLGILRSYDVDMGDDYDADDVVDTNIDTSDDKPDPTFSGQRGDVW